MKRLLQTLIGTLFLLVIASCNENETEVVSNENTNSVIGKWELREIYDSQLNHIQVPVGLRDLLEFSHENFKEIEYRGTYVPHICKGTYSFISNEELLINSSCQTDTISQDITLTPTTLTLGFQGREEYIFRKYFRVE